MLGGRQIMSSCNRSTGDVLLYVGTGCPVGPVVSRCQVGNSNAEDLAGQATYASNAGVSTVTVTVTTLRLYVFTLGFLPRQCAACHDGDVHTHS